MGRNKDTMELVLKGFRADDTSRAVNVGSRED